MSLLEAIGNTPMVEFANLRKKPDVKVFCKLEGCNPGESVKDRPALYMINRAEESGELTKDKGLFSEYDMVKSHLMRTKKEVYERSCYRVDKRRNFGMFIGNEEEPVMYDYCYDGRFSQHIHPAFQRKILCL
jgi:hypothetical protein